MTTRDHVPPLCVFGDALLKNHGFNLITVPSCADCNNPESINDTYFRDAMSIAASTIEDGFPLAVKDAVRRSVISAGGEFSTPVGNLMRNARTTWSSVGVSALLHKVQAVSIKWDRVKATIERSVRGLYWHHTGRRVPDEFNVMVIGDKERGQFGNMQGDVFGEIVQCSLAGARRIVHPDVFMYSIAFASDDDRYAALVLCFYRKVIFLAVVGPPEPATQLVLR